MQRVRQKLNLVLPVTLGIIFLLLYLNFRSVSESLIVMLSVPFALVGGVWFLWLAGYNTSVAVWVGFIALAGVAAETGVVMLIYLDEAFHRRRLEGRMRNAGDVAAAVREGAVERLRPKMMTVVAIMAGPGADPLEPWDRGRRDETDRGANGGRDAHGHAPDAGGDSLDLRPLAARAAGPAAGPLLLEHSNQRWPVERLVGAPQRPLDRRTVPRHAGREPDHASSKPSRPPRRGGSESCAFGILVPLRPWLGSWWVLRGALRDRRIASSSVPSAADCARIHLPLRTHNGDGSMPQQRWSTRLMRSRRSSLAALGMLAAVSLLSPDAAAAQDPTVQLLELLSNAHGPSGFEEPVRKLMVEHMTPVADRMLSDGLGSVIAVQGSNGPRVMIDVHMDELGALVRRVTPDGFLTMQMLGGWLDEVLVGQRWTILGSKGPVLATSTVRDAHLVGNGAGGALLDPRDKLFLDVGATTAAQVRDLGVGPGDPIVPDSPFAILNGTQNYLGKAWDDRVGCAIVLDVMRRLAGTPHPNQLFYAATVQEEIGLRGARTAAELVKPDVAVAIEAGVTNDIPGVGPDQAQEVLGGGPGIFLYNGSELPNRSFVALARRTAADRGIPLQGELIQGYGDDAAEIQKSNGGVPTITLLVPTRYTHTHNGIINRADYDRTVELLLALIQRLDAATVGRLRDFSPQ